MRVNDEVVIRMEGIHELHKHDDILSIEHWEGDTVTISSISGDMCLLTGVRGSWWVNERHVKRMLLDLQIPNWRD